MRFALGVTWCSQLSLSQSQATFLRIYQFSSMFSDLTHHLSTAVGCRALSWCTPAIKMNVI